MILQNIVSKPSTTHEHNNKKYSLPIEPSSSSEHAITNLMSDKVSLINSYTPSFPLT
jgi:hypothetical protein